MLIRSLLLLGALLGGGILLAVHGTRALAFLIALALVVTVPRTTVWRIAERWLVRLTGTRRRAVVVVMGLIIAGLLVVNLYQLTH